MNSQTKFDIIEQNNAGAVAFCDQCDHLHIEIGAFTSVVSRHSFIEISNYLSSKKRHVNKMLVKTPTNEKVLIPVASSTYLSLTEEEFYQIADLFEVATHMIQVREILQV